MKSESDSDSDAMTRALVTKAGTFDLTRLNKLIATHNLYYPNEARRLIATR